MARNDYTPEQAIGMLREAERRLSQGEKIGKIVAVLGSPSTAIAGGAGFTVSVE